MRPFFDPLDAAAAILVCATVFAYLNHRLLHLPRTTALMIMGAAASGAVTALDAWWPAAEVGHTVASFLKAIDFHATVMNGMLSFLLFAGALHVDLRELRRSKWSIGVITVAGVLGSTVIVGSALWWIGELFGMAIPFAWSLLFGALISPTDPVAVLGLLKASRVPAALEATVAGESLFNDGVAIVVFSVLAGLVAGTDVVTPAGVAGLFVLQALGGVLFGGVIGLIAFVALRPIDEHNLEVMITLAVVMGGYALAQRLGVNGPIAMAVAGLIIGNAGRSLAMSGRTRDYVTKFWSLVDEILNAVLFLLIGLEAIVVLDKLPLLLAGVAVIPLVLLARAASVGLPLLAFRWHSHLPRGSLAILVLGGLRGGISVALALAIPPGPPTHLILVTTYAVVLFSMLVQAPLVGVLARRLYAGPAASQENG